MAPEGFDRRAFIKGTAALGAAGAAGALGYGLIRPVSDVNVEVVPISYPGIKVLDGSPAPYGLPLIPLAIQPDNTLRGIPDAARGQLLWYKYCSHERAPGTSPDFESTNALEYFSAQDPTSGGEPLWYGELVGEQVRADQFPATEPLEPFSGFPGVGAPFKWRSEGVPPEDAITGLVFRVREEEIGFERFPPEEREEIRSWFPRDPGDEAFRFLACCSFCTHFCCVPGFHKSPASIADDAGGTVYCTCHGSAYDPFTISRYDRQIFVFPGQDVSPSDVG